MTQVERDGAGFVVSAILLAEAFTITESQVREAMLLEDGWRVATVWECALWKPEQVEA